MSVRLPVRSRRSSRSSICWSSALFRSKAGLSRKSGLLFDVSRELALVMRAYARELGVPAQQEEDMFQDAGRAKDVQLPL